MNINKQVTEKLKELGATRPEPAQAATPTGYVLTIPAEEQNIEIRVKIRDYDRYSATLEQLEVNQNGPVLDYESDGEYLRRCAERVIQRLTYLEEPLGLVELENDDGLAQIRSSPPHYSSDDEVTYWEIQIWTTPRPKAYLARYRWIPGQAGREVVAHPVTFATLSRIAQDLALTLAD